MRAEERKVADAVVTGGNVVLPSQVMHGASIVVEEGRIAAILDRNDPPPLGRTVIDARGKIVLPGVVDAHVHVDTPGPADKPLGVYSDSFESMSRAAAAGGVTTVIPFIFANGEKDPAAYVDEYRRQAESEAWTDFSFHFGISRMADVEAIPDVVRLGVRSFKALMAYKRQGAMVGDALLSKAMQRAGEASGVMMVHAEDGELIDALEQRAKAAGDCSPPAYAKCRPAVAETIAIMRALALARDTGCSLYIVHLSSRDGLEAASAARTRGQAVVIETCPHYLFLSDVELEPNRLGPIAKIGPPLRHSHDNEALWSATRAGGVDIVASDHAPRRREDKLRGLDDIFSAPFGSPGVETLLPVLFHEFQQRRLSLTVLARVLSEAPARTFGLFPRKGAIAVGADADLAIVDPQAHWTVSPDRFQTNARYSVWQGRTLVGKPVTTMIRGRIVVEDGVPRDASGWGRFLPDTPRPF
jgi:D-hydantoinase